MALAEHIGIHLIIESDDQSLADPERWCPKVSGRSQDQFEDLFIRRFVLLEIEINDLFPFGSSQTAHAFHQFQSAFPLQRLFFRVDFGLGFNAGIRKKLLRFPTRFSPGPVVTPIQFCHVLLPFKNQICFDVLLATPIESLPPEGS